jgi:uncharacterized protein
LLLNVQELVARQMPVQLQGTLGAEEIFRHVPEFTPLSPIDVKLEAHAAGGLIVVTGELACKIRMQCSRCLDPIEDTLRIPFEEHFRVVQDADAETNEDDDAVPVTDERLDLDPYLADEILVQLPFAPICKEDCKGLCPECGTNRNESSCGCRTVKIDPRLASLQDWFEPEQQ